jgi:hypothetical protein
MRVLHANIYLGKRGRLTPPPHLRGLADSPSRAAGFAGLPRRRTEIFSASGLGKGGEVGVRKPKLRRPTMEEVERLTQIVCQLAAISIAIRGR